MLKDFFTISTAKAVIADLKKSKRSNKDHNEFVERFNKLAPDKQLDFILSIASHQFSYAAKQLSNGEDIALVGIGSFRINKGSLMYHEEIHRIAQEEGFIDASHVDAETRNRYKKMAKERLKDAQYARKELERNVRGGGKAFKPQPTSFVNPKSFINPKK